MPVITVGIMAIPPGLNFREEFAKKNGVVVISLGRRLTPEAMGKSRKIESRAYTARRGRMLITRFGLSVEAALLLRDALNKALDAAEIVEVMDDEPAAEDV
ncbi:MAG: hypothetical protein WAW81_02125 [Minisyncoccia bacterium]